MILKELENESCSGYGIIKRLEARLGKKPSAGSMYPDIKTLLGDGLIRSGREGKRPVFNLTAKGRTELVRQLRLRENVFETLLQHVRLCDELTKSNLHEFMREVLGRVREGEMPFTEIEDELTRFRAQLLRLLREGKIKTEQKRIKSTIRSTIRELETIQ